MASDDVDLVIICLRAADILPADRTEGAIEGTCARCQAAILLSPTTQQQLARGNTAVFCDHCESGKALDLVALPGQLEEIRKHYGFPNN